MKVEQELGHITTSLNLLISELRVLNKLLKPKQGDSPEYYRVLNEEKNSKNEAKAREESTKEEIIKFNSSKKKDKNLSLAFIQSSVSREYLMERLSHISKNGKGKEVSRLLNKYEAITFSDLKPRYYKEVLREAEGLIR